MSRNYKTRRAAILIASSNLGGAEGVSLNLAAELAQGGNYDCVHCFFLRKSEFQSTRLSELSRLPNIRFHYGGASELLGLPALIGFLMRYRFDIVFSSFSHLNAAASGMRRFGMLRTKRLVTRESTMIFEREFSGWVTRALPLMYAMYGAQDLIICQTAAMRNSLLRHQPKISDVLVRVIANPIKTVVLSNDRRSSRQNAIAWCGRLIDVKEPALALEVLALLPENYRLYVVGAGPLENELHEICKAKSLCHRVNFVGWSDKPAEIFSQCQYGLVTSRIEGFPNVILEMLAAGVSGVATTPCAGELDQLPGVRVSASHAASDLVRAINKIQQTPTSVSAVQMMLESRSIARFAKLVTDQGCEYQ